MRRPETETAGAPVPADPAAPAAVPPPPTRLLASSADRFRVAGLAVRAGGRARFLALALAAALAAALASTPRMGLLVTDATLAVTPRPGALDRLTQALRFETVAGNPAAVAALHSHLLSAFPATFAALSAHTLDPGGGTPPTLLLEWRGTAGLKDAAPGVLIGHLDVVPGWEADGTAAPAAFSGAVAGGWVVSRGALDAKGPALAMLEAVEALLEARFTPRRTLFICLGGDEESGGKGSAAAAAAVAARLAAAGAPPAVAFLLDEGGVVLPRPSSALARALIPGPLFMVGVSEKGWETLAVRLEGPAGHAAQPRPAAPGAVLAAAAARLHARQPAATCGPACVAAVRALAQASGRPVLRLLAALVTWSPLRGPLGRALAAAGGPTVAATLRPTLALTQLHVGGGVGSAANVVPPAATAVFNARTVPGEAPGAAAGRVRAAVEGAALALGGRHHGLTVTITTGGRGPGFDTTPAPPLTPLAGPGWAALAAAAGTLGAPGAGVLPIPFVVPGATDSRHWSALAGGATLRAAPLAVPLADVARVHGAGERVGVGAYLGGIAAYGAFLRVGGG